MTSADSEFAADLAVRAGELLLKLRAESGLEGKELGKAGDAQSNVLLLDLLAAGRPGDAVLSEESADSPARLSADRVWIIDPLDGTREYGMPGRSDWAVHVALWERAAAGITAAAVAQPSLDVVYTDASVAVRGEREQPVFLVSDSRPPAFAAPVAAQLGGVLAPMGSAGAKAMAVLRGDADAYLHAGGQWEWDSAAPVGVALGAGLHASRVDGSELTYNAAHPYLPDLLICRADLARPLLDAIAAAG
ncbi:3'(2'),5'-bisphosphate nucleotidase CysQ [Jatrophihabitans sp.]|uniref:3'(2'),5'-bisphosphate nucleotidase CysQ n=1 Tax=Jatrophihabitans sp. TaxID=1932789 RepID=UPI0030C761A2|nr:3(2),5-bisphosphate nucleotidase CysQ [Jatrophihabitans sp.]